MQTTRYIINKRFEDRSGRLQFALVPVLTPDGNIKIFRCRPTPQPTPWLVLEWEYKDKRPYLLKSVSLTSDQIEAGAVFMRDAYESEGWPEGWQEFQRYMNACYYRVEVVDGKEVQIPRLKPDAITHFPDNLLPKCVKAMRQRRSKKKADNQWKPSTKLDRPDATTGGRTSKASTG